MPRAADTSPLTTASEPEHAVVSDRRRSRSVRTRATIESAALALFTERGIDHTTVEQIADAAGVSPRTFFRHFPHKEAVLFGDSAHETARMRDVLANRPPEEHPMRSLAAALVDAAERMEPDRAQHLMRARLLDALDATGTFEVHLMRQRWAQDVTALLAERQSTSRHTTGSPAAWSMVLMGCFGSAMHSWLTSDDRTSLRSILSEVFDETLLGLGEAAAELREATSEP